MLTRHLSKRNKTKIMDDQKVAWPVAKVVSLWAMIGISTWQEAASFAAFIYSMCLIIEWFYKKIWRGVFVKIGWVKKSGKHE